MHTAKAWIRVRDCLFGVLIGAACTGVILAFAGRFERGATLSGLNPEGGGPGFLLLLCAAVLSLALRRNIEHLRPLAATVNAAFVAACVAVTTAVLLEVIPLADNIDTEPLVSGAAGATFVPRVVAAVLSDAWSKRDDAVQQPSDQQRVVAGTESASR